MRARGGMQPRGLSDRAVRLHRRQRSVQKDQRSSGRHTLRVGRLRMPRRPLRRLRCWFRLHGHGQSMREEDDRLQLRSGSLQSGNECSGRHAVYQWPILLHRRLQRLHGRQRVFAREQSLSHRQGHFVRRRDDDLHRSERAGPRRRILPDEQRAERRMRRDGHVRGVHAKRDVHSTGQAMPARLDDVRRRPGVRVTDEHQRRQAMRDRCDLLGRRLRYLQRDVVRERLLRQQRVRDGGADRWKLRHEGRRVRGLSERSGMHDGRRRVLLSAFGEGHVLGGVHGPANRHEELRRVRQRLHDEAARGGAGDVQCRRVLGAPVVVRARMGALHHRCQRRLRDGRHSTRQLRHMRTRLSTDRAPVLRLGRQRDVRHGLYGQHANTLRRGLRRPGEQPKQLRSVRQDVSRGGDLLWLELPVRFIDSDVLRGHGHVFEYAERLEELRGLRPGMRLKQDVQIRQLRLHERPRLLEHGALYERPDELLRHQLQPVPSRAGECDASLQRIDVRIRVQRRLYSVQRGVRRDEQRRQQLWRMR